MTARQLLEMSMEEMVAWIENAPIKQARKVYAELLKIKAQYIKQLN